MQPFSNESESWGRFASEDYFVVGVLQSHRADVDCIMTGLL